MLPVDSSTAERLTLGGDEILVLTTSEQSRGAICAVQLLMRPGGGPPVMHRHEPSEVYYVLEGEFTFYVGDPDELVRRVTARPGQVFPLAGGTAHTIRNETDRDAVAFVVYAPGAAMEGFVRAGAELASTGRPDMSAVVAIAAQNGIELLGPVPQQVRA